MTTKNSTYVTALLDFLLDNKPYHSKITELEEEYQFNDSVSLRMTDKLFTTALTKENWANSYFSGGSLTPLAAEVHKIYTPESSAKWFNGDPLNTRGAFKVGRDESTDFPSLPLAFNQQNQAKGGLKDVTFTSSDSITKPLLVGLDVFQSRGAFISQIQRTTTPHAIVRGTFEKTYVSSDGPFPFQEILPFTARQLIVIGDATELDLSTISINGEGFVRVVGIDPVSYDPTYTDISLTSVVSIVSSEAKRLAWDSANTSSSISKIKTLLEQIETQLLFRPTPSATTEINILRQVLNTGVFPIDYSVLLNALDGNSVPVLPGYNGWIGTDTTNPFNDLYVNGYLDSLIPGIVLNSFTDLGNQQTGALRYNNIFSDSLRVQDISGNSSREQYEEWKLVVGPQDKLLVYGSASGFVGVAELGTTFTVPQISFTLLPGIIPLELDDEFILTPSAQLTIHETAALETWSIIKTDPIAFTRPILQSGRYGRIRTPGGVYGKIDIVDPGFPTSTISLTAINQTSFLLTSSAESNYTTTITVGTEFNDDRLAFVIEPGTEYGFGKGDQFILEIKNDLPVANDLGLYYGYDMDPYDAPELVYNNANSALDDYLKTLDFGYDTRFATYDLAEFNLRLNPDIESGRAWRLRAIPNLSRPLLMPDARVNLLGTDDPQNPNAAAVYDSAVDADNVPDILLYYADTFAVEYLNEFEKEWVQVDVVGLDENYSSDIFGFQFHLVSASKPFIGAQVTQSYFDDEENPVSITLEGGDTIYFKTNNPPPILVGNVGLLSIAVPRLLFHPSSFYDSIDANWELTWSSETEYTLLGTAVNGPNIGPFNISLNDGLSFKDKAHGLHWTVNVGMSGLSAGDKFTFTTKAKKPSYLVYGSVSGWQEPAIIGEWYWNGKIGFKIEKPRARLFIDNAEIIGPPWSSPHGTIRIRRLQDDAPFGIYQFDCLVDGHWMMSRNGQVVGGGTTLIEDEYLSVFIPNAVAVNSFKIEIVGDKHPLSIGHDIAIVNAPVGLKPLAGDFIDFDRTVESSLIFSIEDNSNIAPLSRLNPVRIDPRFSKLTVDNLPASTSPELQVVSGWIPIILKETDTSAGSLAEYSDKATAVTLIAASTGQVIGTIDQTSSNAKLNWDASFHDLYLPLNAQATIVTLGTGMGDRASINFTDRALFLLASPASAPAFSDSVDLSISDSVFSAITSQYGDDAINISVIDEPFVGFQVGYDNLPYDAELGDTAYYDLGQPLVDSFIEAKHLLGLQELTQEQSARLDALTSNLGSYLDGGNLEETTLAEFLYLIAIEAPITPANRPSFGLPISGHAFDIRDSVEAEISPQIRDVLILYSNILGTGLDVSTLDQNDLDALGGRTAFLTINTALDSQLPSGTWEQFYTATEFVLPIKDVVISMPSRPTVYVWEQGKSIQRCVVIKASDEKWRIIFGSEKSNVKLVIL